MPNPPRLARVLALSGLGLCLALPAQSGRGDRAGRAAAATTDVAGVSTFGGGLLGVARRYRVEFGERSATFRPALGRKAPEPAQMTLGLSEVRRGERVLLTSAGNLPRRAHDRRRVTYSWRSAAGFLVDERWEPQSEGVELSLSFAARPPGRGDLVVRFAIDSSLPSPTDKDFAWRNSRGGGVTIGTVTGVDAAGRRCSGGRRLVEGGVELSLPARFVDEAVYPLVLDPLIATAVEALPSADCDFPDVAYDAYTQSYCVVWTQFLGGGQTGVVGSVFTQTPLARAYAFAINQPGNEDSIRVCHIGGTGLYAMFWVNRAGGQSTISGLAFEPSQAQATNVFNVYGPGTVEAPIVSGEATIYDDDCLLAWLDGQYGLLGCSVQIDQQFQVSATPTVQIAAGNVTEPAFSKQGGAIGLHLVTWVDRPPGSPGWVRAQVVDHDMNLVGLPAWIRNAPQDAGYPALDGDGFRFLVAWEEQEALNPSATDIRGRLVTVSPAGITTLGGDLTLVDDPGDIDYAADVARLGDKFGLVYSGRNPNSPWYDDSYFLALSTDGTPIGAELRLELTPGTDYVYEHAPRLIGHRDGDPGTGSDGGLVVFADQSITTADSDVGLQAVAAMGPGGLVVDLGGGCGPGGLAVANGPFALGNAQFACELFGAQTLAVPFLLFGLPATPQTCGYCTYIQPFASRFVANTAGHAQATVSLPGDPSLIGTSLDFQFASFQVAYVGCFSAPGVAASNIVRATLDY